MFTATFYESRQKCRCSFFQVRCTQKSGDVVNFTTVACRISSRLKRCKNYKNRLRLAKVIVKNILPRFLWFTVYSFSANNNYQTSNLVVNIKAYMQNKIIIISKQQNDTNHIPKSQTSNLRNVHRVIMTVISPNDCPSPFNNRVR